MHAFRRFSIRPLTFSSWMSLPLLLSLSLEWLVSGSAYATPTMYVEVEGTNLQTGTPFRQFSPVVVGGELFETAPLGNSFGINGAPLAEGFSSESGTFWGWVRTGVTPYYAASRVVWHETYQKQATSDTLEAEIAGGHIILTDFGGDPSIDFLGRVEFHAIIRHPSVTTQPEFHHEAEVTGSYDAWTLVLDEGDLAPHTSFRTESTVGLPGDDKAIWELEPVTIFFDLQNIPIGDTFQIIYIVDVTARGRGGETSAAAYFRDPVSFTGGITVVPNGPIAVPEPSLGGFAALGLVPLALMRARRRARQSALKSR